MEIDNRKVFEAHFRDFGIPFLRNQGLQLFGFRQRPDLNTFKVNLAVFVVALQSNQPGTEYFQLIVFGPVRIIRLNVIDYLYAVYENLAMILDHFKIQLKPLVVVHRRIINIADSVEAARLFQFLKIARTLVTVIDLNLVTAKQRAIGLHLGMKNDTRIAARFGLYHRL